MQQQTRRGRPRSLDTVVSEYPNVDVGIHSSDRKLQLLAPWKLFRDDVIYRSSQRVFPHFEQFRKFTLEVPADEGSSMEEFGSRVTGSYMGRAFSSQGENAWVPVLVRHGELSVPEREITHFLFVNEWNRDWKSVYLSNTSIHATMPHDTYAAISTDNFGMGIVDMLRSVLPPKLVDYFTNTHSVLSGPNTSKPLFEALYRGPKMVMRAENPINE